MHFEEKILCGKVRRADTRVARAAHKGSPVCVHIAISGGPEGPSEAGGEGRDDVAKEASYVASLQTAGPA
jgi:hypothetical protein